MNMFRTLQGIVATAALVLAANANAVPVTFDLANGPESSVSVTSELWCLGSCGVTASLNPGLDSLTRTLSAGQSWWFDFFTLNFYGTGIGSGTVDASLGFDAPAGAPNADGTGSGLFATANLRLDGTFGFLTWEQPGAFSLADGSSYSVLFEDLIGITGGQQVNVRARLTLNSEPAVNVPEPSSTALMGVGLLALGLGLGASRRRRNKAMQF